MQNMHDFIYKLRTRSREKREHSEDLVRNMSTTLSRQLYAIADFWGGVPSTYQRRGS